MASPPTAPTPCASRSPPRAQGGGPRRGGLRTLPLSWRGAAAMASLPQESATAGWLPGGGRRGIWRSRESQRPALGLLPARRAAVASQRLISGSDARGPASRLPGGHVPAAAPDAGPSARAHETGATCGTQEAEGRATASCTFRPGRRGPWRGPSSPPAPRLPCPLLGASGKGHPAVPRPEARAAGLAESRNDGGGAEGCVLGGPHLPRSPGVRQWPGRRGRSCPWLRLGLTKRTGG